MNCVEESKFLSVLKFEHYMVNVETALLSSGPLSINDILFVSSTFFYFKFILV
jgi:hypothetical protein